MIIQNLSEEKELYEKLRMMADDYKAYAKAILTISEEIKEAEEEIATEEIYDMLEDYHPMTFFKVISRVAKEIRETEGGD